MKNEEIKAIRDKLNALVESGEDLCSKDVLKLSQELDELISEFIKQIE